MCSWFMLTFWLLLGVVAFWPARGICFLRKEEALRADDVGGFFFLMICLSRSRDAFV